MRNPHATGDPNSQLLILGEAPSKDEIRLGEPFVGPSGEVLNDLLHTAGILRNQVYIMNVWPFMVTKNAKDIKGPYGEVLWTDNKGLTEPGQAMAEHTIDLIKRSGCNAILALGNVAMS